MGLKFISRFFSFMLLVGVVHVDDFILRQRAKELPWHVTVDHIGPSDQGLFSPECGHLPTYDRHLSTDHTIGHHAG